MSKEWKLIPKHWAAIFVLICLCTAFASNVQDLLSAWLRFGAFYGHGLIVILLVIHLVWQDRARIFGSEEAGSRLLAVGAFVMSVVWFVAWISDARLTQYVIAVCVAFLATCAVLGRQVFLPFGMPFALMFLTIPASTIWVPPLQVITTYMVERLLRLVGVPTLVEQHFVTIPAGVFEIEGGCSGVGFFLVAMVLGGYLALQYRPHLLLFTAALMVSAAIGMVANWLRILTIILIAHNWGMGQPMVGDHGWLGWSVFAVLCVPALLVANRFLERRGAGPEIGEAGAPANRIGLGFVIAVTVASAALPFLSLAIDHV